MHGAGGLADGVEDADGVLEIVDAGAEGAFGEGDVTGLDCERNGVAVTLVGAVDGEAGGRHGAIPEIGHDPDRTVGAGEHLAPPQQPGLALDLCGTDAQRHALDRTARLESEGQSREIRRAPAGMGPQVEAAAPAPHKGRMPAGDLEGGVPHQGAEPEDVEIL